MWDINNSVRNKGTAKIVDRRNKRMPKLGHLHIPIGPCVCLSKFPYLSKGRSGVINVIIALITVRQLPAIGPGYLGVPALVVGPVNNSLESNVILLLQITPRSESPLSVPSFLFRNLEWNFKPSNHMAHYNTRA